MGLGLTWLLIFPVREESLGRLVIDLARSAARCLSLQLRWSKDITASLFSIDGKVCSPALGLFLLRGMILRTSSAFTKRFKCILSNEGQRFPQERRLDSWSSHFVRVGRKPLVVVMNDATLYTLIIPATGIKGFPDLWLVLLKRLEELWAQNGAHFDFNNQSVILMARTNRSLIGSMNDAIQLIRFYSERANGEQIELDLVKMELRSNETPYKALGYEQPVRLMASALRSMFENE